VRAEWGETAKRVLWSRAARPVVGGKSAAGNLRAVENHDHEQRPILVWAGSLAAFGKEHRNQQHSGKDLHVFLYLLSGGTYDRNAV